MSFIMWLIARKKKQQKTQTTKWACHGLGTLETPRAFSNCSVGPLHVPLSSTGSELHFAVSSLARKTFFFFFLIEENALFFVLSCTSGQGNHPSFFLQSNHHSLYKITNYPFSINPSLVQDHMRRGLIEVAPRFRISSISPCLEGSTRPHH